MSHRTFIYSGMIMSSSIASTCVPRELNWGCFSTSQTPPWDIQNEFLLEPLNTTCQKPWLCLCIPCTMEDTLGSSGVKFGLSDIKYGKKCCPLPWLTMGPSQCSRVVCFVLTTFIYSRQLLSQCYAMGPASDSGNCLLKLG